MSSDDKLIDALYKAIIAGDENAAKQVALRSIDEGNDLLKILNEGGTAAIREVGDRFGRFECFLPEMMLSAYAMQAALEVLATEIRNSGSEVTSAGKVLLGTVAGDFHDIGKNLVGALLTANGFEVLDMGVDIPSKDFAAKAKTEKPDILALSALMSTSAYYQQEVIGYLKDIGIRDDLFVIVGGGPVTGDWALEIGADGYGRMASDAVEVGLQLMKIGTRADLKAPILVD